jgi:signal transduction histidine kinase
VEARSALTRNTIRAHLVALVAIQIVLVAVTIVMGAREDFRQAKVDAKQQAATTADYAAQFVVEERESSAEALGELPSILSSLSVPEICELIADQPEDDSLRWFHGQTYLFRPDGSSACAKDAGKRNVSQEPWFTAALASAEPVSHGPIRDPFTQKLAVFDAFSMPGQVVAAYTTDLDSAGPALDYQFGKGPAAASFTITARDRSFEIASSGKKTGRPTAGTPFATKPSGDTFEDLDGVERVFVEKTVPGEGWHLYAGISTDDVYRGAREELRERVMLGVLVSLLFLAASLVLARRFARPIRALVKGTKRFGAGDTTARVQPAGPSELRELGRSFNEMMKVRADAEEALRKAYSAERKAADDLREIDEMRTAFLRAISHELRTPLTSVVGYATFLDESMDAMPEESVRSSITAISVQSKRLERLLLDLLDVDRISRGTVEPNLVDIDVGKLALNVVEQTSANRRIKVDVNGAVPALVDAALVERIIENLVFNAMKHTPPEASIWVKVRRYNGHVRIYVEDSGDGVPDEIKSAIFEPFKQGNVPAHSPGTGIGLSLVAQFAKLHGGRAWVVDRRGGGASFRVELPAKARSRQRRRRKAA